MPIDRVTHPGLLYLIELQDGELGIWLKLHPLQLFLLYFQLIMQKKTLTTIDRMIIHASWIPSRIIELVHIYWRSKVFGHILWFSHWKCHLACLASVYIAQ